MVFLSQMQQILPQPRSKLPCNSEVTAHCKALKILIGNPRLWWSGDNQIWYKSNQIYLEEGKKYLRTLRGVEN